VGLKSGPARYLGNMHPGKCVQEKASKDSRVASVN